MQNQNRSLLELQKAKASLSFALEELERAGRWEMAKTYRKTITQMSEHIKILCLAIETTNGDAENAN